ncbi:MAG: lipoprotein-releasing system ATP-binding protein LolD [Chlorobiaceae bacterium]|nr:lipoprotein-releasing system ATP-binding protein LolD [Chlorobiaceae bacterium]
MNKIILNCKEIYKSYYIDEKESSRLEVLKGIDFEISEEEIVTIVGASGSGKSTLLHILGGLDNPTSGKVFWHDKDISLFNDETVAKRRSENIGFIFQFHHLLPEFTSIENVMIPLMIAGVNKTDARTRAVELLSKVGMLPREEHKPTELSGGEQQRVAVARALANQPKLVLADEPTGNLDSASGEQLHELLLELNKTEKQSFVIVTHNDRFAKRSDRNFVMTDGKLLQI